MSPFILIRDGKGIFKKMCLKQFIILRQILLTLGFFWYSLLPFLKCPVDDNCDMRRFQCCQHVSFSLIKFICQPYTPTTVELLSEQHKHVAVYLLLKKEDQKALQVQKLIKNSWRRTDGVGIYWHKIVIIARCQVWCSLLASLNMLLLFMYVHKSVKKYAEKGLLQDNLWSKKYMTTSNQ